MPDLSTFRAYLSGDATVTGLVSTRIYPNVAPPDTAPPYITFRVVSGVPHNTLNESAALSSANRIQMDCYSDDYLELTTTLRDAVEAAIAPYGWILFEQDVYEDDTRLHRRIIDFSWHN